MTHVAISGMMHKKLNFVDEPWTKWCTEFEFLGIEFYVTLTKINRNFEISVGKIKKELHHFW